MKQRILVTMLLLLSVQVFGQQKSLNRDTLVVPVNDEIIVKISTYENGWLKYINGFSSRIDSFLGDLSKIQDKIPKNVTLELTSEKIGETMVTVREDRKEYLIEDTISFTRKNEARIYSDKYDIFICFNKLDDLFRANIQKCVNNVVEAETKHLEEGGWVDYRKGKFHGIAWTTIYNNCDKEPVVSEKSHYNANKSQLSIKAGAGAGIIKNELNTDFTFRIGKFSTRKGILKHHIYISDNMLYMFDEMDNIHINNFINLGYRFNSSNRLDKYNWIGLEAGYLTNSSGDFFKTPTWRLGTMIDLRHNITLTPYIYFDDGFNKIYPGIRIGIDLGP